ncbi:MAG: hypothetical protein LBV12_12485 [Puniceicoccales bacterium]|jgi:archaellum biogenesis protein FlaJ (TadC family)|nr:hypothetical protein [Puniceicoccales bacterium]
MAVFFAVMLLMYNADKPAIILCTTFGSLFLLAGIFGGYIFLTRPEEKYRIQEEKENAWIQKHPIAAWLFVAVILATALFQFLKLFGWLP